MICVRRCGRLSPAIYPTEGELGREYFYNKLHPFDWAALGYAIGLCFIGIGTWFELRNPWPVRVGLAVTIA